MLGIDPAAMLPGRKPDPPMIWPDMRDGVALFFAMATQWNWTAVGMGAPMRTGLKYEVLRVTAHGCGIKYSPAVFSDVRALEGEALATFGKR